MKLCNFSLLLLAGASSVSASSEGHLHSVPDANDISFLQASVEFQHLAKVADIDIDFVELWPQQGDENLRCGKGGGTKVESQSHCQQLAEQSRHPYYEFDASRNRCATFFTCSAPTSTTRPWKIFWKLTPIPNSNGYFPYAFQTDYDTCDIENCMTVPGGCRSRPECGGCTALCFGGDEDSPNWVLKREYAGVSKGGKMYGVGEKPEDDWHDVYNTGVLQMQWYSLQPDPPCDCDSDAGCKSDCDIWELDNFVKTIQWEEFDKTICLARQLDKKLHLRLWTGYSSPKWIYDPASFNIRIAAKGMGAIPLSDVQDPAERSKPGNVWHRRRRRNAIKGKKETGGHSSAVTPDVGDPNYHRATKLLYKAMAWRIETMHGNDMSRIVNIQPCVGATGDNTPFPMPNKKWDHVYSYDESGNLMEEVPTKIDEAGKSIDNPKAIDVQLEYRQAFVKWFQGLSMWLESDESGFGYELLHGDMSLLMNGAANLGDSAQGAAPMAPFLDMGGRLPWSISTNLSGGIMLKWGTETHAQNLPTERYNVMNRLFYIYKLGPGNLPLRSRGEMSAETCYIPSANSGSHGDICSPPRLVLKGYYAMAMWLATVKVDHWQVWNSPYVTTVLDDPRNKKWFDIVSRYTSLRWGWESNSAFINFRDGLDFFDLERFPEFEADGTTPLYCCLFYRNDTDWDGVTPYPQMGACKGSTDPNCQNGVKIGSVRYDSTTRANAIAQSCAARGCRIEDDSSLSTNIGARRAHGINDGGFGVWKTNYGSFMREIPSILGGGSIGWWRVPFHETHSGSTVDSQPFGRTARGYAEYSNPDATIEMMLDTGLWGGLPLSGAKKLYMRVIFFDDDDTVDGTGKFEVHYDSMSGPKKLATVHKSNTGRWQEFCAAISDGRFGGGVSSTGKFETSMHLALRNGDQSGDLFDSVEITNSTLETISLANCCWTKSTEEDVYRTDGCDAPEDQDTASPPPSWLLSHEAFAEYVSQARSDLDGYEPECNVG